MRAGERPAQLGHLPSKLVDCGRRVGSGAGTRSRAMEQTSGTRGVPGPGEERDPNRQHPRPERTATPEETAGQSRGHGEKRRRRRDGDRDREGGNLFRTGQGPGTVSGEQRVWENSARVGHRDRPRQKLTKDRNPTLARDVGEPPGAAAPCGRRASRPRGPER